MNQKLSKIEDTIIQPKNDKKTRILYARVSSLDQKTDRQTVDAKSYDLVIEDKCSGTIPFFEREGGRKIKLLVERGCNMELEVKSLDRLGRSLLDILNTIIFFNMHKISIYFVNQGLKTLNDKGEENPVAKMVYSILGVVAEMEKKIRKKDVKKELPSLGLLENIKEEIMGQKRTFITFCQNLRTRKFWII